jgi:hypothetical protein
MTVKILGLVRACTECMHRQYYSGSAHECTKVQQILPQGGGIPVWCPLPDHPAAHIAPAQRSVEMVRQVLEGLKKEVESGISEKRLRELVDISLRQLP